MKHEEWQGLAKFLRKEDREAYNAVFGILLVVLVAALLWATYFLLLKYL